MNIYYKLVAIGLIAIVILALINIYVYSRSDREKDLELKIVLGKDVDEPGVASLKITASYEIKVYRGGELIVTRHKENDPISIQWYRMVANMMFGFIKDGAVTWYDTGYNERTWVDTAGAGIDPRMYIALGSGSGTPSRSDYKLFNEVTKDISSMSVTDDSSNLRFIIMYTKTFTVSSSFTLTEVGLELYVDSGYTSAYLLVAHDAVSPSVSLVSGDSVAVTYQITIPYNTNGPFTKWFYYILIDYWLGYKGTTGNILSPKGESGSTGIVDTYIDTYWSGPGKWCDSVDGEYTFVEVGDGTSTISSLWETYALDSLVKRMRIDNTMFQNQVNETSSYTIEYIVSFTFTSNTSIKEIGVSYNTDTSTSSNNCNEIYYLILYWSLPSPVNVDAGNGLRVEITIEIPYA